MRIERRFLFAPLVLAWLTTDATAAPVTFTFTYNSANFQLGNTLYTDATISIILTGGDTRDVVQSGGGRSGVYYDFQAPAYFSIAGGPVGGIFGDMAFRCSGASGAMWLNHGLGLFALQDFTSLAMDQYDFTTSVTSRSNTASFSSWLATTYGTLTFFQGASPTAATFTADVQNVLTPEPSSLTLAIFGVAAPVVAMRRRRRV